MNKAKAALIMGSDSDFPKLESCIKKLKAFDIDVDVNVISAHRTPDAAAEFSNKYFSPYLFRQRRFTHFGTAHAAYWIFSHSPIKYFCPTADLLPWRLFFFSRRRCCRLKGTTLF